MKYYLRHFRYLQSLFSSSGTRYFNNLMSHYPIICIRCNICHQFFLELTCAYIF